MKQYIKPSVDVVELSVKENIADMPNALKVVENVDVGGHQVTLTTYNLAASSTSINQTPGN